MGMGGTLTGKASEKITYHYQKNKNLPDGWIFFEKIVMLHFI
jgi:hypothetical protein